METLVDTCKRTGFRIHSYVLMSNHYHLLMETPEANLVEGMRWFQGTYTARFNSRHRQGGHVFQGRYKAIPIEGEESEYFRMASDYIHLNPVRLKAYEKTPQKEKLRLLLSYPWSSLHGYLRRKKKEAFIDYSLVLGEYGGDTDKARKAYA